MSNPVNPVIPQNKNNALHEDWSSFYNKKLDSLLKQALRESQSAKWQPEKLKKKASQVFHLLQLASQSPDKSSICGQIVLAYHPWPAQWDMTDFWRKQVEMAVQTFSDQDQPVLLAEALTDLAEIDHQTGKIQNAIELAQRSLSIARQIGAPVGKTGNLLANLLDLLGDKAGAAKAVDEIQAYLEHNDAGLDPAMLKVEQAHLCFLRMNRLRRNGRLKDAIELINSHIHEVDSLPNAAPPLLAALYEWRAILYWVQGDFEKALADLITGHFNR